MSTTLLHSIQGLPMGRYLVCFRIRIHRLSCQASHRRSFEHLYFLSSAKARITKELEQKIIEIGRNSDRTFRFLTIVRDRQSGAVIYVGNGKGVSAWDGLSKKLRKKKRKAVAMDMSNAYACCLEKHFPKARIVFDHFHVIKLTNERLDKLWRRYVAGLDASQRRQFKTLRMLFLRNMEGQDADSLLILRKRRKHFKEFGDTCLVKEALRSIYATASNALEARAAFRRWATLAVGKRPASPMVMVDRG